MRLGSGRATAAAGTTAALLLGDGLFGGAAAAGRRTFFRGTATALGGFAGGATAAFGGGFTGTATAATAATARLMGMAVGEFGEFSRADGDDLDVEVQGLASELMVAVEGDFLAFDLLDGEDAHAEVGLGVETHADLGSVGAEGVEGHQLEELLAVFAVAELRRDEDALGVAGDEAVDALFEAGNNVLRAVEILHRAAIAGGVDDVALVVLQGVFDGDDGFFGYAHGDEERRT